MDARDQELRTELDATLQARRELGTEYESALIESFLGKVEQRLDATIDRQVRRQLAESRMVVARGGRPAARGEGVGSGAEGFGERFGFAIITLILAVPLSAIAANQADLEGLIVTWLGIVGVNAVHAFRGIGFGRNRARDRADGDSDWEK